MQTCNTSQQRDQSEVHCAIGGYGSGGGGGGGCGGGGGGGGGDVMRQSALCLILNKIYSNITEYDLQLIIDIKLFIDLQIEF
jgi:hypothetical protein